MITVNEDEPKEDEANKRWKEIQAQRDLQESRRGVINDKVGEISEQFDIERRDVYIALWNAVRRTHKIDHYVKIDMVIKNERWYNTAIKALYHADTIQTPPEGEETGLVYFLKTEQCVPELVKVGFVKTPKVAAIHKRKASLAFPFPLTLVAHIQGTGITTDSTEKKVHHHLSKYRCRNGSAKEWFYYTDEVKEYIDSLQNNKAKLASKFIFDLENPKTIINRIYRIGEEEEV